MSAFERLTPALQYQITHTLDFKSLRPVQEMTIGHVLDGRNCVVLAPTAGGKTEAAFFPVLSLIDARDAKPVSVIYTSPIRALLNNQEARVSRYAQTIGRRAFKWHGDVGPGERKRFLQDPADILLTTPESLEAMLMSPKVPAHKIFRGLETIIIDEVHAFADDDRGAHLSALLERLSRYCGRDLQRIGLSATVGNPEEILTWIGGRSKREGVVVSPPKEPKAPEIAVELWGDVDAAAERTKALHPGRKRLVFVDSRRGVEDLAKNLVARGVDTYLAHGSLSVAARRDAERAFAEGTDCVIAATSALELGIDVGDLDHVLQLESPRTVASFLQRMGRTGRRGGTTPNCTFLITKSAMLLQAAALLHLHGKGFVESVRPSRRASHIFAHQLMALGIQEDGIGKGDYWAWLDGATPFADLTAEDRAALVGHMLEKEILADQEGRLWLGPEGEKRFGRANFSELYAVFSVPREIVVFYGEDEVGTIDSSFLEVLEGKEEGGRFILGGRPWQIESIDWKRGRCRVHPLEGGAKAPRWMGGGSPLGYELCQAMRDVLLSDDRDPRWNDAAAAEMKRMREEHAFLRDGEVVHDGREGPTWWTFAGGRANLLLARMIEADLGSACTVRNTSLTWKSKDGSKEALRDFIARMREARRPTPEDARAFAAAGTSRRLTKFEPCLPPEHLFALVAERALDLVGAQAAVGSLARSGPPWTILLRISDSERSPATEAAARGDWAGLPDVPTMKELNTIGHYLDGYQIAIDYCGSDAFAIAQRLREHPEELATMSTPALFAAFFASVRGWRGFYEWPAEGSAAHAEAAAWLRAVRDRVRARPEDLRFVRR